MYIHDKHMNGGGANWTNRSMFHGDNLKFLRAMNSESVDLIATASPFNTGRDFHATLDSLAKGAKFQDRWSWEQDVHQEWIDQLTDDYPKLIEAVGSAWYAHLLAQHGSKCQGCDRHFDDPRYLELDHNTPRSSGGWNHTSNRILLCGPCNKLKSNIYTLIGLRRENRKRGYVAA